MNGTGEIKEPLACTEAERGEFARLVRQAFDGSDEGLPGRIRDASRLAFWYAAGDTLAAIAGLKVPGEPERDEVFQKADARVSPAEYCFELGWVFVVPSCRGIGIGEGLSRRLLALVPTECVYATTRPDNTSMIRILRALDFSRAGSPYPHSRRNEELALFLRPQPTSGAPDHAT